MRDEPCGGQRLIVRLFGEPSVSFDGVPMKWTAPPGAFALLALISLKRDAPASRSALATALWPDELDTDARANLRRHLHHLQRSLPALGGARWIDTDMRSVAWNPDAPVWVDLCAFERAASYPERAAEAVACYGGNLLEGYYDDAILEIRERLRATYAGLLARLTREAREAREFERAIGFADKLLAQDEWMEDAVRERIAAIYESGDRSGALAAYERFARRLYEEFGAEPMRETIALRDLVLARLPIPENPASPFERQHGEMWKLPFVGRSDVFERLRSAWSRAARRHGCIAFVSGEAGIGKSRLALEIAALVRAQGGFALLGSTANPEAEPYQTFVTALRPMLSHVAQSDVDRPWLAALAQILPEIAGIRPDLGESEALPEQRARERLIEAFARTIERLSAMRPVCLVLEDMHWAGAASIDLLAALGRRAGVLPVLIVVTYRSEESTTAHPIRALRTALIAEHRAIAVPLDRLTPADVSAVVASIAVDDSPLPEGLSEAVARLSEGNPLFVAQLLEGYRETGRVPDAASALHSIGDAISARAARLDAGVRAVAEAAAGIGEVFRSDIVADVGGWDERAVLDAIGALIDRALVREAGSGALEYAFTHALVAASFYEMTSADVRIARHRRTAQVLERAGGEDLAIVLTIARHWKLAGDREHASAAYARAARAALALYARDEAIEYAREALAACDSERERFELLQLVVSAEERSERIERWVQDLNELESMASRLDPADRYAALAARERYHAQTGDREAQARLIEAMFALAREIGSPQWQVEAGDARGQLMMGTGQFHAAIGAFREALSIAQSLDDRRSVSRVRQHLAQALMRSGETAEAAKELERQRTHSASGASAEERLDLLWAESSLALATEDAAFVARIGSEMLELGARLGDQEAEAKAHWLLGWAAMVRRDIENVRKHYADACVLFERLRQPQSLAATYVNLGVLELETWHVRAALEAFERGAALAEQTEARNVRGFAITNLADAHRILGNLDKALEMAIAGCEIAKPTGDRRLIATALGTLGSVRCARGETSTGVDLLRESAALWRASGAWQSLAEELCRLIEAYLDGAAGDDFEACALELRELYEREPEAQKQPGRVLWLLAKLARRRGDEREAADFEERARSAAAAALQQLAEEESRAAFLAMPHNRDIFIGAGG